MIKNSFLLLFALSLLVQAAHGGGFKIGLQGTKQLGIGHTGIGYAQDAATIYFNPAGMSFVDNQFNGSINLLGPSTTFLDGQTNALTQAVGQVYTPFSLYAKGNLSKRIGIGLGVYTPFGSGMRYPYEWTGRFALTSVNLETVYIQPTISLKISPKFSLGAGYIASFGMFELERDLPLQNQNGTYAHAKLEGAGRGRGFNLGAYYHSGKKFDFGVTYHSSIAMDVKDGDATFSNIPTAAVSSFPSINNFSSSLQLPSELGAGFSYKLSKNVHAAVDVSYTYWESYDYLSFNYTTNTSQLQDSKSPRLYENAIGIHGGLQAYFPHNVVARIGAFYDETPVQDGYVGPELPDNNKVGLTGGLSYTVRDNFIIDVALLYEDVAERTDRNLESNLYGTFKTKVICPSFGISYKFKKNTNNTVKKYTRRY